MINVYADYTECRNEADRWCKSVYSWPRWGEPPDHNAAVNEIIYLSLLQQSQHVCVNVYGRCDGDDVEVPTTAIHPSISWHTHAHTHTHRPYGHLIPVACLHCDLASSRPWSTYGGHLLSPKRDERNEGVRGGMVAERWSRWVNVNGEIKRLRRDRDEGSHLVLGWCCGVWWADGRARGGACLVLATLHKSHGSPPRGSRLAVQ